MSQRYPYWNEPGTKARGPLMSAFPRPTPVRQTLQTQTQAVQAPSITTEKDLLIAIARAPYGEAQTSYGRSIVIAGDIVITKTIDLASSRYSGLRITSTSRSRLIPHASMHGQPLFSISTACADLAIDTLTIYGETGRVFSDVITHAGSTRFTLAECIWHADALYTGSGTGIYLRISGNRRRGGASAGGITGVLSLSQVSNNVNDSSGFTINVTGSSVSIANNVALGDIDVGAGSTRFSITGNVGCGDIDTSASDGLNVIDGNVSCGTLTTHASDALGLNT